MERNRAVFGNAQISQSKTKIAIGAIAVGYLFHDSDLPKVDDLFSILQVSNNLPEVNYETLLRNSNQTVFNKSAPAVVRISVSHGDDVPSFGTGSILSEDGFVITNWHVIAQASEITIQLYPSALKDAQKIQLYQAQLIKTDPKMTNGSINFVRIDDVFCLALSASASAKGGGSSSWSSSSS